MPPCYNRPAYAAAQPASLLFFSWSAAETVAGRPPHTRANVAVTAQRPVRVDAGLDQLAIETWQLLGTCARLAAKEHVARATPKNGPRAVGFGLPGWVALPMGPVRGA